MAEVTSAHLVLSLDTGQVRKTVGGGERNSRERPQQTISRTQASIVEDSHWLAYKARRPPIGDSGRELLEPAEGSTPPSLKGALGLELAPI